MTSGNSLKGREILLGVTGGIAAYKSADLTSKLVQAGASVSVVLTRAARKFRRSSRLSPHIWDRTVTCES